VFLSQGAAGWGGRGGGAGFGGVALTLWGGAGFFCAQRIPGVKFFFFPRGCRGEGGAGGPVIWGAPRGGGGGTAKLFPTGLAEVRL